MNRSRFQSHLSSMMHSKFSSGGGGGDSIISAADLLAPTAWYDAFTTAAGVVNSWADKSGNGNHATQGTGSKQPTCTASQQAGKNGLIFDNGDTLVLPSGLFTIPNGANTLFAVAKLASEAAVTDRIIELSEAGSPRWNLLYLTTAGQIQFLSRTGNSLSVVSTGNTNTNTNIIMGRRSGTTQAIAINNGTETADTNGANESGCDAGYIGSRLDTDGYLNGTIFEILIYNRSLSAAEIIRINRYLSNKWSITIS